ncbi:uncharacterized protein N7484_000467 [Penicillium longicatenatum]|uniref:uncharacterized protein n=1 Tax=Penicillium longicatenatum TaxID=1561947 RepID=UPI002546AC48|nr:uncharacterized protein N7484_000467 [Penicillium longicatenatum]KAJ5661095.1 hypothetical protein N7484_000467 [Penicillium longicatenatum]
MTTDDDSQPPSDDELFLLRRFGALNARIILALQDEVCQIEEELKNLDHKYMNCSDPVNNGSFRQDIKQDRKGVLARLRLKLKEYNEFVVLHSELKRRSRAEPRLIKNILNWHETNEGAILDVEKNYIREEEDLITITPSAKTPLHRVLEKTHWFNTSRFFRQHRPRSKAFCDDETIFFHSKRKIEIFDTTIVLLVGLAMLLIPIWILDLVVKSSTARLGVISLFIALFLFGVQMVTGARPGETLAATAGYAAVLMVFLQAAS